LFRAPNDLFAEASRIQVMRGQGIMPGQHDPVTDLMGDAGLPKVLDDIRRAVNRTVMQMPAHQDYFARCSGRPGGAAAQV
jgi:tryptophan 7-halogenase